MPMQPPLQSALSGLLMSLVDLGGTLLLLPLMLPVVGLLLVLALGGRYAGRILLALSSLGLASAAAVTAAIRETAAPLHYNLGGWLPPLGVALKADGLSVMLLLTSSVVIGAVGVYAQDSFRVPRGRSETRTSLAFWLLLFGVWGGLNIVVLAQDLFTLFVALELLTFSAVPLVSLGGRAETIAAALRYLLFALLGSVLYLLGAVLFYGTYGTLDIGLLTQQLAAADPVPAGVLAAISLMTVGLLAKTALLPLHLWLPPAHSGAPPAASAILSALVVKGSFFVILRIWFDLAPWLLELPAAQVLGILGASAILLGNLLALAQVRLKLLVAYSTIAQIGYLFLIFPLAASPKGPTWALTGGALQVTSHALAKAAMFLAAGLIAAALGHDRVRGLGGVGRALPITVLGFALAGLSLVGLQPSGGYLVKTLLQGAAETSVAWWWPVVLDAGGLLTAAYLTWVLGNALSGSGRALSLATTPRMSQQLVVLVLALAALLLGLLPAAVFDLIAIGRTLASEPIGSAWVGAFSWARLASGLWPVALVVALVVLFGPWRDGPRTGALGLPSRAASVAGRLIERLDLALRQWTLAGVSLLLLTVVLAAGLLFSGT